MDTLCQQQRTPRKGCSAPGSVQLSTALKWCGTGSHPTNPASQRMMQADIYSNLKQSHQICPYGPTLGKDDALGNAAASLPSPEPVATCVLLRVT